MKHQSNQELEKTSKRVENFEYLGGWMSSTEKEFEVRKALAWTACHKLKKNMEIQHQKKDKGKTFSVNRRVHTLLWFRNMDINQDLAETAGWMLHPNAENGI